jgi:hypothetical protein
LWKKFRQVHACRRRTSEPSSVSSTHLPTHRERFTSAYIPSRPSMSTIAPMRTLACARPDLNLCSRAARGAAGVPSASEAKPPSSSLPLHRLVIGPQRCALS